MIDFREDEHTLDGIKKSLQCDILFIWSSCREKTYFKHALIWVWNRRGSFFPSKSSPRLYFSEQMKVGDCILRTYLQFDFSEIFFSITISQNIGGKIFSFLMNCMSQEFPTAKGSKSKILNFNTFLPVVQCISIVVSIINFSWNMIFRDRLFKWKYLHLVGWGLFFKPWVTQPLPQRFNTQMVYWTYLIQSNNKIFFFFRNEKLIILYMYFYYLWPIYVWCYLLITSFKILTNFQI